jgi:hypothetical protein
MIGEPARWETNLQLLIDLLLTEGRPVEAPFDMHSVPQIPVIACNMDFVFMAEACMPRLERKREGVFVNLRGGVLLLGLLIILSL